MDFNNVNPSLMKLVELLKMSIPKPSHGYTISEAGPEVVTAPGVYFPSEKGQVIPLQSRVEGGSVSPTSPSSDTEKEKLAILRDIISVIKPRQGMESRQFGGPVSPDSEPSLMDQIEKTKYDIFKSAMSVLKPQKQSTNLPSQGPNLTSRQFGGSVDPSVLEELLSALTPGGRGPFAKSGGGSYNERTSPYGSPSGPSQFAPSLPTPPSLPGLPKPITSSSYGMMPDAFKPSEGEALWQKKRAEAGWENPAEDLWEHKRKEAGVFDLTSRQYGGFVSPDLEEIKKRNLWEQQGYPEKRLEEVRKILGPSVLGVQPGFQKSYYEAHPEEKLMDEETARMKPLTDAIMKSIEDERTRQQGYGLGFGPTPNELRLGKGRGREQPSQIPELVTAGGLLAPKLTKGLLPAGVKTPSLTTQTETNEDKYSVSMYNKMYRDLSEPERQTVDIKIKEGIKPPTSEIDLIRGDLKRRFGKEPTEGEILAEQDKRKLGGISPLPPGTLSTKGFGVKGVKNEGALEGLNEEQKGVVRGLTEYKYPWPGSFAMRDPKWQALLGRAQLYDPDFSEAEYQVRYNLRKSFTSGKEKDNILALNTATGHINSLVNASKELANSDWPVGNAAMNLLAKYFPVSKDLVERQGKITSIKTKFNAVVDEMAGIFKRTGATDAAIKSWRDTVQNPETATPEMWKGFVGGALELMGSRIEALRDIYEAGMGRWKDFPLLSGSSRKILKGLGVDVDRIDRVIGEVPTEKGDVSGKIISRKAGETMDEYDKRIGGR